MSKRTGAAELEAGMRQKLVSAEMYGPKTISRPGGPGNLSEDALFAEFEALRLPGYLELRGKSDAVKAADLMAVREPAAIGRPLRRDVVGWIW